MFGSITEPEPNMAIPGEKKHKSQVFGVMAHTIPMELSSSMTHTHNIPGKKAKSCSIKNRSIAAPEINIVVPGEKELKSQVFGIIPGFIIIYFGFLIKEKTDS